jgi:hypothetical protein
MYRKCERGFSFVEFMMVATVLSFVSTGVKTFVFDRGKTPTHQFASSELAGKGRASVKQMVQELELAGNYSKTATPEPGLLPVSSSPAIAPFLVAEPDHVVFEAHLEGDGIPERVEYRLWNSAIWRRVVSTNPDDAASPAEYELVTEYVDNGDLPLFQYDHDPYHSLTEPASIQKVWVTLQLRPPVVDPKRPQFRTLRFDGLAQRQITEDTVPVAGLQKP